MPGENGGPAAIEAGGIVGTGHQPFLWSCTEWCDPKASCELSAKQGRAAGLTGPMPARKIALRLEPGDELAPGSRGDSAMSMTGRLLQALLLLAASQSHAETVLRVIAAADLRILDPLMPPDNQPTSHGYLIYDQLFGLDGKFEPKP